MYVCICSPNTTNRNQRSVATQLRACVTDGTTERLRYVLSHTHQLSGTAQLFVCVQY